MISSAESGKHDPSGHGAHLLLIILINYNFIFIGGITKKKGFMIYDFRPLICIYLSTPFIKYLRFRYIICFNLLYYPAELFSFIKI